MEPMAAWFDGPQRHGAPSSVLLVSQASAASQQMSYEISGKEGQGRKGELGSPAELLEVTVHLEAIRIIAGRDKKLG